MSFLFYVEVAIKKFYINEEDMKELADGYGFICEREGISENELEEMILTMADIVVENRQLRHEVKRLGEVEKEFHDYIMEEYRSGEQDFGDIIRIPLDPICRMNLR